MKKKHFDAPVPVATTTSPPSAPADESALVIKSPGDHSRSCTIDLSPWLGKGFDAWLWVCAGQLGAFLYSGSARVNRAFHFALSRDLEHLRTAIDSEINLAVTDIAES